MRLGSQIMACLVATAFAAGASGAYKTVTLSRTATASDRPDSAPRGGLTGRFLSFRSLTAQIDNQVIANLLSEHAATHNDLPLSAVAGEITRCELRSCAVPVTVRLSHSEGPVTLAFAVSNAKGELSDVYHAECGTGACNVSLILARGPNTISIGAVDGLNQSTAYTTLRVNATRAIARAGKSEWF
jgi:hypothetical protein